MKYRRYRTQKILQQYFHMHQGEKLYRSIRSLSTKRADKGGSHPESRDDVSVNALVIVQNVTRARFHDYVDIPYIFHVTGLSIA